MNEVTSEWVTKADSDFYSADVLLHSGDVPLIDTACFHCQQCAEKYVKARLEEAGVRIPKTHDLGELLKLALPFAPLWSALQPALRSLSQYAVAFRYPGDEATDAEVKSALTNCKAIRKEVRLTFGLKA